MNERYISVYESYNELYHHGILGQKWGIRRYQNTDGSLTTLGKKHYGIGTKEDLDTFIRNKKERKKLEDQFRENLKAVSPNTAGNNIGKIANVMDIASNKNLKQILGFTGTKDNERLKALKKKNDDLINQYEKDKNNGAITEQEFNRNKNILDKQYNKREKTISVGTNVFNTIGASSGLLKNIKTVSDKKYNRSIDRMDLSQYTNAELKAAVDEMMTYSSYNQLMSKPRINRGREAIENFFLISGGAIALATAGVGLYKSITQSDEEGEVL